ncbi:malate synthase A, partial [Kitasatospora sp. NPDC093558]
LDDRPNQLDRTREDAEVTATDLLAVHRLTAGLPTEQGLRANVAVTLRYLTAWLGGAGAVAVFGLLEDVATAEIARCQLWQWQHHCTRLAGGSLATADLVRRHIDRERSALLAEGAEGADPKLVDNAVRILEETALGNELPAFLTTEAYTRHLVRVRTAA